MVATITALREKNPWIRTPLVINGPMGGFAGPDLASSVTNAGGFGFIAAGYDLSKLSGLLSEARTKLAEDVKKRTGDHGSLLPVGVGFLCFGSSVDAAAAIVEEHRPAAAWLFASHQLSDYVEWAKRIRTASPETAVWVQTGSVSAALEIAQTVQPDVLVLQGADAGGHGLEKGAGIISLFPEAADALQEAGLGTIPLVAAGGIVDGRGAAAALVMGAAGVVMGTRFLASNEVKHQGYQRAILKARDGGQTTTRSKVFDEAKAEGNNWPVLYDGRALVNKTYEDFAGGKEIGEIRRLHGEALEGKDAGFDEAQMRATVWAGTGVGLINDVRSAGQIVEDVREGAKRALASVQARF